MTSSVQLGPLVFPIGPLLLLAALLVGWTLAGRLARGRNASIEGVATGMLLWGLLAARLAFLWEWRSAYAAAPLTMLDVRDGGWNVAVGVAVAALLAWHAVRRQPALRAPVLWGSGAAAVVGLAGSVFLLLGGSGAVRPLPDLALPSLDGPAVQLAAADGRPTVINLWATWCPPCHREMPAMQAAQDANPDVRFLFISQGERPETVRRYMASRGLKLEQVLVDEQSVAGARLGHRALPTTLFFDARGRLVSVRVGELSRATLAQRLSAIR
jgi:thiol-disulfide isomerase/thioredoxin